MKVDKPYCVVGELAYNRTWTETADEATKHASDLLSKAAAKPTGAVVELFVVKMVRRVSIERPIVVEDIE